MCLWGCFQRGFTAEGRLSLSVVQWAPCSYGLPSWNGQKKKSNSSQLSPLSASWLWAQCDQLLHNPCCCGFPAMVGCTLKPWGKIKLPHWVPFVRYCVAEYEKVNTGRMMKDLLGWGRAHIASKTLPERDRCHQKPSISNSQSRGKTTPDKSILAGKARQERDPHHFNFF